MDFLSTVIEIDRKYTNNKKNLPSFFLLPRKFIPAKYNNFAVGLICESF